MKNIKRVGVSLQPQKSDILEKGPFDIITALGLIEFLSIEEFKNELKFLLDNLKTLMEKFY